MQPHYDERARGILAKAADIAREKGQIMIEPEHIVLAMTGEKETSVQKVLKKYGIDDQLVSAMVDEWLPVNNFSLVQQSWNFSPASTKVLRQSREIAEWFCAEYTTTEHILLAILKDEDCPAIKIFRVAQSEPGLIYADLISQMKLKQVGIAKKGTSKAVGVGMTENLDKYGRDLTQLAREGKLTRLVGREAESHRLLQVLCRFNKNNPCLVGAPGVGKTAIVAGFANAVADGTAPKKLRDKQIYAIDLTSVIAGSRYRGDFEERMKNLMEEIAELGNVILFINDLHTIVGTGSTEGGFDAANILKPALARGEIQVIGAATDEEYRKYIEKDAALERRFQPIRVDEPTVEQSIDILNGVIERYKNHYHYQVDFEPSAIEAAVKLSDRYINDRSLPDKALDIIDETAASIYLKNSFSEETENKDQAAHITAEDIAATVSQWSGVPITQVNMADSERLLHLEELIGKRVIGQEQAVAAVARAMRRGRTGIQNPNRPIGSFLFLGPTGVGKTELGKVLAEVMFDKPESFIRLDMSEYMEPHSVAKMIGAPPGYVGFEDGGQLSEKVRKNPYSVVLFDEIEKAHPDVFNILLQVLDDGRLTDSKGRVVNFKNTILIMTSNAGIKAAEFTRPLGFNTESDEDMQKAQSEEIMSEIRHVFRPEFLNRIDDIIVFRRLTYQDMIEIIDLLTGDFIKRCKGMGSTVTVSTEAKQYIINKYVNLRYGARPLKRALQSELENKVAEQILEGSVLPGDEISVEEAEGQLVIKIKKHRE